MNTKQLKYFLVTAERSSITGAARELDVAQPAISLQLANLEHELKTKLFERDFRGVRLTETGNRFKKHAEIIMQQIQLAKADLNAEKDNYCGTVVLGVNQEVCNVLAIDLLNEIEHRFPNIELKLRIAPSYIIEEWLHEGSIDIAINYERIHSSLVSKSILLLREKLFLIIARQPKNPAYAELAHYGAIPFSELQHYAIFLPDEKDSLTDFLYKQASDCGIQLKRKKSFGQLMTTLHYVSQGFGLAVLPSSAIFHLENTNQIRAVPIIQPKLERDVFIQMALGKNEDSAVGVVMELIRQTSANVHANRSWRGRFLDTKYALPDWSSIENLIPA